MTSTMKKVLIAVVVIVVAACAAGFFYWTLSKEERSRKADPEKYVIEALTDTLAPDLNAYDNTWIFDILGGRHASEISFKLKDIDMPLEQQQYMLYAQLASLNLNMLRDGNEMSGNVGISVGGAPLVSADLYMSDSELALRFPQGFDYFITIDPKSVSSEWDSSNLGSIARLTPLIGDNLFYSGYMQLFTKFSKTENLIRKRTSLLMEDASYEYLEKLENENPEKTYLYSMTVQKDNFNQWYNLIVDDLISSENTKNLNIDFNVLRYFSIDGDIQLLLHVTDGLIRFAEVSTQLPGGVSFKADINLNGVERPLADISAELVMDNPNPYTGQTDEPTMGSVVEQYLMLEKMPAQVKLSISHSHSLSADTKLFSHGNITADASGSKTALDWDFSWDRAQNSLDNLILTANADIEANGKTAELSYSVTGNVMEADDKKSINLSLNDISIRATDFNGDESSNSIELKYNLSAAPDSEIGYDRDTAMHISEISPLDLLKIYSNLQEDPVLGGLLTGYLQ